MDSLCPGSKDAKHLANVLEVWEKHLQRQEVSIKRPMLKNKKETNRKKPFSPRAEDSPLVMMWSSTASYQELVHKHFSMLMLSWCESDLKGSFCAGIRSKSDNVKYCFSTNLTWCEPRRRQQGSLAKVVQQQEDHHLRRHFHHEHHDHHVLGQLRFQSVYHPKGLHHRHLHGCSPRSHRSEILEDLNSQ